MLNITNPDTLKAFFELNEWDISPIDKILNSGEPYKISHLTIGGKTLIEKGFKGEQIGEILEHLRKVVINDPTKNNPQDLLNQIP